MNYTQNERIKQVGEKKLIVGIDVGSEKHYARAFDWRGMELSKKAYSFRNDAEGFAGLLNWLDGLQHKYNKDGVIPGMEPTGHYWFNLATFLHDHGMKPVLVNPLHVKRSKELDDYLPSKNDMLRVASNLRDQTETELTRVKNRIQRWFSIYFPEYKEVYKDLYAASSLMILKVAALPCDVIEMGAEKINQIWRDAKLRAVGKKRAQTLVEAAQRSIGHTNGLDMARFEIFTLIEDYERLEKRSADLLEKMSELIKEVSYSEKLLQIKCVGLKTVVGFIAEVGDISRFTDPKQIQKLAGQAFGGDSSGKHTGQSRISKRGRKRLRCLLFEVVLALAAKNPEFREIHKYYTTRKVNPLKKKQSLVVLSNKLIRIFYTILSKGIDYDPEKLLGDIRRPAEQTEAA